MHFTLHQLHILLKTAETGSITKAAEELHLSQPAISIQLKNLQSQFDVPLFEVVHKKVHITELGKEVADAARQMLEQSERISQLNQRQKGKLSGKLKISVVSTGKYVMPFFLDDFLRLHPAVELMLDVSNKSRVVEDLQNNRVDFSLVSVIPAHMQLKRIPLMKNKLVMIVGKDSPSNQSRNQPVSEIPWPLIVREEGSATRQWMERFIQRKKIRFSKTMELTSNEAVKQAIMANLGCSIVPLIGIKNELKNKQVRIVPLKGLPMQTEWNLVWPSGKKQTVVAATFLNHIQLVKDDIIKKHFEWTEKF